MDVDKQDKQTFLRQQILQKQYDPEQFIKFMNQKLNIGDNLDLCTFAQLKSVVQAFVMIKNPPQQQGQNQNESTSLPIQSCINQAKQSCVSKPKQIMFTKYSPNIMQYQYSKSYQCRKIQNKFGNADIRCFVSDPERKTTGGFFGIGQTSFLEFKVRTPLLKWNVGRRYSDFIALRNYLIRIYPAQIVPPIPQKKAAKRTKRHLEKRMKILEYFLNDLTNIPEFINNKYVQGFLSISDGPKFKSLQNDVQKVKGFSHFSQCENYQGEISIKLSQQNNSYYRQMQKLIPKMQTIYKQLTRNSKGLQSLYTQQVNTLYQMGNLFAQLHQSSRQILNKLPKSNGLSKLNDIFITSNNMMIQWGNVVRNQYQLLERNFNTFFKYIRNQLHGYRQVQLRQTLVEDEFAKLKIALERKKEKIYNMHDASKWDLTLKEAKEIPKEVIHDKTQAYKIMLPKQNRQLQRLRDYTSFYLNELHKNGNNNMERSFTKFCQNFKQLTIKMKVNSQQLCELWNQMSSNFSGTNKKSIQLKQAPINNPNDDQIIQD